MSKLLKRNGLLASLIAVGMATAPMAHVALAGDAGAAHSQSQSPDHSQNSSESRTQAAERDFSSVDQNRDNELVWTEIYAIYDTELDEAGWDESSTLSQYDTDRSAGLDANEYVVFLSGIAAAPTDSTNQQAAVEGAQRDAAQSNAAQPAQPDSREVQEQRQSASESSRDAAQQRSAATETSAMSNASAANRNQDDDDVPATPDISEATSDAKQAQAQSATSGTSESQQAQAGAQQQGAEQSSAATTSAPDATAVIAVTPVPVPTPAVEVGDLIDRDVINLQGQSVGDVEDVVLSKDGTQAGLVVGVGGFLGMGEKQVFVDVDQLLMTGNQLVWNTPIDKNVLEALPAYESDAYISIAQDA